MAGKKLSEVINVILFDDMNADLIFGGKQMELKSFVKKDFRYQKETDSYERYARVYLYLNDPRVEEILSDVRKEHLEAAPERTLVRSDLFLNYLKELLQAAPRIEPVLDRKNAVIKVVFNWTDEEEPSSSRFIEGGFEVRLNMAEEKNEAGYREYIRQRMAFVEENGMEVPESYDKKLTDNCFGAEIDRLVNGLIEREKKRKAAKPEQTENDTGPADERQKKTYRTRLRAGAVADKPDYLNIITTKDYQYAITFNRYGLAHLSRTYEKINTRDGKIMFDGIAESEMSIGPLCDSMHEADEKEQVPLDIDLNFFRCIFSFFEFNLREAIRNNEKPSGELRLYLPDLAEFMGYQGNRGNNVIEKIKRTFDSFHDMAGILKGRDGSETKYALLVILQKDGAANTITICSPYINLLLEEIYKSSIIRDKKTDAPLKNAVGTYKTGAVFSNLVHNDIVQEKNTRAVEIVLLVVTVIEQAGTGKGTPNIAAKTIVERIPEMKDAIENAKRNSDRNLILKRSFKKAWELLRDKTSLQEVYKEIVLPDPEDPEMIPNIRNWTRLVFRFPHKGKNKD